MDRRKVTLAAAAVGAVAGIVGLAVQAVPAGAGPAPSLPSTTAEELVRSVMTMTPPALGGTIEVRNNLGLPALPGLPQAANGTSQVRVWADGQGRSRLSLPNRGGEQTFVDDGTTSWKWDSASRTVTKHADKAVGKTAAGKTAAGKVADPNATEQDRTRPTDPASASKVIIEKVRDSSTVSVDGTATVANRPAYELVLTPKPSERTLLREVRIAVDSATHVPLRLVVLANGSTDPALQIGFSDLNVGQQDSALFTFAPPAGATVKTPEADPKATTPEAGRDQLATAAPKIVGDGWDSVVVAKAPAGLTNPTGGTKSSGPDPMAILRKIGKHVSGPWGDGTLVTTKVGSVLLTSDGRVAAGAVPEQVLYDALAVT